MVRSDLRQVWDVHVEAFDGYFMTKMGRRFGELYYSQYLGHPHTYALVAVNAGRVVGFIVGGSEMTSLQRRLYRRHFLTLGGIIVMRFVSDSAARASIVARTRVIRTAFRALSPFRGTAESPTAKVVAAQTADEGLTVSVMSIAVLQAFQGFGIGSELERRFIETARADGAVKARRNVLKKNDREIQRNLRWGWRVFRSSDSKVTLVRDIGVSHGDAGDRGGRDG